MSVRQCHLGVLLSSMKAHDPIHFLKHDFPAAVECPRPKSPDLGVFQQGTNLVGLQLRVLDEPNPRCRCWTVAVLVDLGHQSG